MKNKILMPALLIMMLVSCKKSFLEKPADPTVVKLKAQDLRAILDNSSFYQSGNGGLDNLSSDDYVCLSSSILSLGYDDPYVKTYRWAPDAQILSATERSYWGSVYTLIYYANVVIQTLKDDPGNLDQTTINTLKGEALFHRASKFYYLAQTFTKPYDPATAGQDLGIPVRTSPDLEVKSERGTVAQTYAQMITDFKEAISLLPETSTFPTRPNKASANAALARVYLVMGDYVNAGSYSNASLSLRNQLMDYNTLSTTSTTPFPKFNSEVLFWAWGSGSSILGRQGRGAFVAPELYALYTSNDLRKVLFFKSNASGIYFSGNYTESVGIGYLRGPAVDEMYLTRAECYARQGKTSEAMTDLNALLVTRFKTGSFVPYAATNADDALAQILTERRKELTWRGIRWADLRRLNKDPRFAKTLTRVVNDVTYTLPPNDLRYTLLLPKNALDNSTFQQNPR